MGESILTSIKKMLGMTEDYTHFDTDIIIHINTAFMTLNQLGIGPSTGFKIEDNSKLWMDYIREDDDLEAVKTYIYLKVKLVFDPPLSSAVMTVMQQSITELEWRLNVQTESK
ncbi:MAG: hypothetical protein IKL08_01805 [Clostridia bacterium]|nr:hypothetical protein [Clostridia bacterium]